MLKVAFLDRDGVINRDEGYTHRIQQFEFIDGSITALTKLQKAGYSIIIITNQSGIGRGFYSVSDYQLLTNWYKEKLKQQGVHITDVFYCPHHPKDQCQCRKPLPGLFQQAAQRYRINFTLSFMIGDRVTDIDAAKTAGVTRQFLINTNTDNALLQCVTDNILA